MEIQIKYFSNDLLDKLIVESSLSTNSLSIQIPFSYAAKLVTISWNDVLFAISNDYFNKNCAIEYACSLLANELVDENIIELAILNTLEVTKEELLQKFVAKLAYKETEKEKMESKDKKSRDNISDTESGRNVQRYIRLTYLIPELLKLVDEERIAFTPAVEISYLSEYEQRTLLDQIEFTDATPSLSQAQRLRKFSEQGRYSTDVVFAALCEEKPNQKEQVRFMEEDIRKYFPKSYTKSDMQKTIILLLEKWQKQRERNRKDER